MPQHGDPTHSSTIKSRQRAVGSSVCTTNTHSTSGVSSSSSTFVSNPITHSPPFVQTHPTPVNGHAVPILSNLLMPGTAMISALPFPTRRTPLRYPLFLDNHLHQSLLYIFLAALPGPPHPRISEHPRLGAEQCVEIQKFGPEIAGFEVPPVSEPEPRIEMGFGRWRVMRCAGFLFQRPGRR